MDSKPDWMDFYKEFSYKLLEYSDKRGKIIEDIYQIYEGFDDEEGIHLITLDKDDYENEIKPKDIDPFTILALFNRGNSDEKPNGAVIRFWP